MGEQFSVIIGDICYQFEAQSDLAPQIYEQIIT